MLAQDRLVPMGTIGGRLLLYPPIIRQGAFGCWMTQGCLDGARHDGVLGRRDDGKASRTDRSVCIRIWWRRVTYVLPYVIVEPKWAEKYVISPMCGSIPAFIMEARHSC